MPMSGRHWKIQDRVIEVSTQEAWNESVVLIGLNAENGDVTITGADRQGTVFVGTWVIKENGDAVVELESPGDTARKRLFKATYHLMDKDTLTLNIESPDRRTIKLVRLR